MKELRIYPTVSKYETIIAYGENTSTIVSKLIGLAARYCDSFASDIVYDINDFIQSVESKNKFSRYLLFYSSGVHGRDEDKFQQFMEQRGECRSDRKFYLLAYDPEKNIQTLKEMDVFFI